MEMKGDYIESMSSDRDIHMKIINTTINKLPQWHYCYNVISRMGNHQPYNLHVYLLTYSNVQYPTLLAS